LFNLVIANNRFLLFGASCEAKVLTRWSVNFILVVVLAFNSIILIDFILVDFIPLICILIILL
jgi:hypothetical protein